MGANGLTRPTASAPMEPQHAKRASSVTPTTILIVRVRRPRRVARVCERTDSKRDKQCRHNASTTAVRRNTLCRYAWRLTLPLLKENGRCRLRFWRPRCHSLGFCQLWLTRRVTSVKEDPSVWPLSSRRISWRLCSQNI